MKSSKFSPTEIAKILKGFESGKSLDTIVREYGVSKVNFINGVSVMAALKLANSRRLNNLKKRTLNSSACMQN